MSGAAFGPRRELPGFLSAAGVVVAVSTIGAVALWAALAGGDPFSPGGLNGAVRGDVLGGVSTHAALRNDCEACHTAPWSGTTMGAKCVGCHRDVGDQMRSGKGLHARMGGSAASPTCRGCHTEHGGSRGQLTFFDHSAEPFKLTGAHRKASCDQCHPGARTIDQFKAAPQRCYGCHRKDDAHDGQFGQTCDQCHNVNTWDDADFEHKVFPLDHGREERKAECKTCHPKKYREYTCFGCHEHTTANVVGEHEGRTLAQLRDCIRCHEGGRAGDD